MLFTTLVCRPLAKALAQALALVLPPTCLACDAPLTADSGLTFCPACYNRLPRWDTSRIVPPVLPPHVSSLAAPFLYQSLLREVIIRYKFTDHPQFARTLARQMQPLIPAPAPSMLPTTPWLLVPVPMHPAKLRQRGFNQSALLARHVARLGGHQLAITGLTRTVLSPPQASRTRAQRQKLPASHFQAAPAVHGRHVLLIDDIYTTGATARACALALKRGGALSVHVLTLAYTPLGHDGPEV